MPVTPTSKPRAGGAGARRSRSQAAVNTPVPTTERELDGTLTEYFDVDVRGDRVERLSLIHI